MASEQMKRVVQAKNTVTTFFKDVLGKPVEGHFKGQKFGVTAIRSTEKGWRVLIEVVEDPGSWMDPILGLYEVFLDKDLNITAYERKSMRRASEVSPEKATIPK